MASFAAYIYPDAIFTNAEKQNWVFENQDNKLNIKEMKNAQQVTAHYKSWRGFQGFLAVVARFKLNFHTESLGITQSATIHMREALGNSKRDTLQ